MSISKLNTLTEFKRFLADGGGIRGFFPNRAAVLGLLNKHQSNKKPLKILYGETYDLLGITVDSLRYYLFLSLLHAKLQTLGLSVNSTVLIADTASTINPSSVEAKIILEEGKKRLRQINEIIRIYHLPIKTQLMSDLFLQKETREIIVDVQKAVMDSSEMQILLNKTVLQNRIHQENKTSYKYGAEAIATALLFDLKLGPPRERFYDEVAMVVAKRLHRNCYNSIYLTPTFPLGLDFVYFLLHPEIEEFGLTPYKAGSNKLQDCRIILGKTSPEQINQLITTSFIPKQNGLPNPVEDLLNVSKVAGTFLKYKNNEIITDLRTITIDMYQKNIEAPLRQIPNI